MNCEKLKRGADRILNLIYPERCVFCDMTIGPSDGGICPGCRKSVEENTGPVCFKCGRRLKDEREELWAAAGRSGTPLIPGLRSIPTAKRW